MNDRLATNRPSLRDFSVFKGGQNIRLLYRRIFWPRLKQCQRVNAVRRFLQGLGVARGAAWRLARSGKGWWRKSISPPAYWAMTNKWLEGQGLESLVARHSALSH